MSIVVSNRYSEIRNVVHNTRLKKVLENLVVYHRSSGFDLKDETRVAIVGGSIERLLRPAV